MREIDIPKLIGIFAITTLIFMSGFLFARFLTDTKISDLESNINDVTVQTSSVETEYSMLLENPCTYGGFNRLTASLDELGQRLVFNEAQKQQNSAQISSIKENYFLLETRHWLFVQKLNSKCGTNLTPVLYFYSENNDCEFCKAQGIVLSAVKLTNPEVMVYSFDINADYSLVSAIKEMYNVTTAPSVVVNNTLYPQFLTQEEFMKILDSQKTNKSSQPVACNSSNSTVA